MKKLIFTLLCGLFVGQVAWADSDVVTKDVRRLPAAAQTFVKQHFAGHQIDWIKIEKEFMEGATYDVRFTNGADVDFDSKGAWTEIEHKQGNFPTSVLPAEIPAYVAKHYAKYRIVKAEKEWRGYDIGLSNGVELKFDSQGKFLRIDK